jgi:hypothetical protein|tara:strand:- start:515 stop:673 length:159 start_codon:yes stop_codon:yes gene_type:complete
MNNIQILDWWNNESETVSEKLEKLDLMIKENPDSKTLKDFKQMLTEILDLYE